MKDLTLITQALRFASDKHRHTRRKGVDIPYINHPIEVMSLLQEYASVVDAVTLSAALMHDLIEDEGVTKKEIAERFGESVADVVDEVTDDPLLSKSEQIKAQVKKAPFLSMRAALLKLADKTSNIRSVIETPPQWQRSTKLKYLKQAKAVVEALPKLPEDAKPLLNLFYDILEQGLKKFKIKIKSETVRLKVLEVIKNTDAEILFLSDFDNSGDTKLVSKELSKLVLKGKLIRVGKGIYAKALFKGVGEPIPTHKDGEIGVLAEIMVRLGQKFDIVQSEGLGSQFSVKPKSKSFKRKLTIGKSKVN